MSTVNETNQPTELRRRAEMLLAQKVDQPSYREATSFLTDEIRRELYELHVHQIELEIQNEELRRIQLELENARSRYFDLYDLAPLGYCTIDKTGSILEANLTLGSILEQVRSRLINRPITQFIHPIDQDAFYLLRKRVLETGKQQSCEIRMTKNDKCPLWARLDVAIVQNPNASSTMRVMVTDITDQKLAEEDRVHLNERLHNSEKLEALGVLASGVAHNMNNVLGIIMGAATQRQSLATDPADTETYSIIARACENGRDVVRSLVQFAKPTLANQAPLKIQDLLTGIRQLLQNTTRGHIKIIEEFSDDPLWIMGDAGCISSAIMNLSLNALDAMENGGCMVLRASHHVQNWVEVSVEDSGGGIPLTIMDRITEPFFTTKPVNKGAGLGLSSAHGVIKAHGGTLEIFSQPGNGTTARFMIPRIPAPAPATSPSTTTSFGSLRILVVDDDDDVRLVAKAMLKTLGHTVEVASSGKEALATLQSGLAPDLIILDQNMPEMDGEETFEKIRLAHPEVHVLFASGQLDIDDIKCLREENVSVISKPFSMNELQEKIEKIRI